MTERTGSLENEVVRHVVTESVEYLQFKRLLAYPEIKHAYILKANDLNFRVGKGLHRIEAVKQNLKTVAEAIEIPYESIVRPDFDHTNHVDCVEMLTEGERPELKGERFPQTDGLVTEKSGITLLSTNADCNLLLCYDPVQKVIANVHAGWRGTFGKIAQNAIQKMKQTFGCDPSNILVCFCPSIRRCCFGVEEDVASLCREIFAATGRLEEILTKGEVKMGKQKYYVDTILINRILLEQEGVLPENIEDCGICSLCHSDLVHSRRAEGEFFGLGCALIEKNL